MIRIVKQLAEILWGFFLSSKKLALIGCYLEVVLQKLQAEHAGHTALRWGKFV